MIHCTRRPVTPPPTPGHAPEALRLNSYDKTIRVYIHSGRHVVPGTASEQAGEFPVDQQGALFI